MKHLFAFCLLISILVSACGASPANTPVPVTATPTGAEPAASTRSPVPVSAETTIPAATQTSAPTQQPSRTPSAPETCPQGNAKTRAQFGSVFKAKKVPFHDARQVVIDFLNNGGDPQTAIEKLAENKVSASLLDVTADGVPEFFLPSGYLTIFGCKDGKYQTLLDLAPTENTGYEAVPLVVNDLNMDGVPEMFIAQVQDYRVKYVILEWDGTTFAPITVEKFGKSGSLYIEDHNIYASGQSHEEAGTINGNWQVTDTTGDGLKDISIKAGVNASFSSSNMEEQMVLAWNGTEYAVASRSTESTPTNTPTTTPLPFSETCDYKGINVQYQYKDGYDVEENVKEFLNAGGDLQQLHNSFDLTIQDLTNDGVSEIILVETKLMWANAYIFSCINGSYESKLAYDNYSTTKLSILSLKDINNDGLPEIVLRAAGCFADRCGGLFIAEWNGTKFASLIKDDENNIDYIEMDFPQDSYIKDIDNDGISEVVWVGGKPDEFADQSGLPWRVETHTYKWDGKYYVPQLIEYSKPVYRFQAVQDGDQYALHNQLEKAIKSYREAINNDGLGWWSEDREKYLLNLAGFVTCGENKKCPQPEQDLDEQYALKAYATYRIILTQILLEQSDQAANTYSNLINEYPLGAGDNVVGGHDPKLVGSTVSEMATAFWKEYQASKDIGNACTEAVMFAERHKSFLPYIGSDYHGWQMDNYKPIDICPFK